MAGPIERSNNLLPQFKEQHPFRQDNVIAGLKLMVWGYFLKVVLADRCAIYVDAVCDNVEMHNGGSFLVATILFTFQIYGDFAGYSLIAIGAARIMGFHLMENFHRPYFAHSVGDFWRRWHISLSTWLKDYVYIPLGGSRAGQRRTYINLILTLVVSGVWHGANWTYISWGLMHGIVLCIERALGMNKRTYTGMSRWLHVLLAFSIVCGLRMLYRAGSLPEFWIMLTGIVTNFGLPFVQDVGWGVLFASFAAIVVLLVKELIEENEWFTMRREGIKYHFLQCAYIAFMIAVISLFGVFGENQFIYFQF